MRRIGENQLKEKDKFKNERVTSKEQDWALINHTY